ncbi:DUF2285 domain-containing protein [Sinirhodobacter populi]|uniref:DUF2285 domain-containing protein n=1 Tax=Paenirhodobacter populi TaxID=2306993 RepID=A0A443KGM5_9RHOB|nr:DUF2285 domain-containing protein [Sinirhodobacter populi]RWR31909.1 DUF2285 domain-containing protein [Sinirhodobacter populi]
MAAPEHLSGLDHRSLVEFYARRDDPEGTHAIHGADPWTQLLLLPGAEPRGPLVALVPLDPEMLGRLEALVRFWRSLDGRTAPPDTRMTAQQRRRLRLMLQAADGRANGASYRDIAIALYGERRVAAEAWKTSPLRDSVIGLVRGARAVIGGGYLNLLRHRRRS